MSLTKEELAHSLMQIDIYPVEISNDLPLTNYNKLEFNDVKSFGASMAPLINSLSNKDGLYRVTIPKGGKLAARKDGTGFIGAVLGKNTNQVSGQATLNPVPIDPAAAALSIALASITEKLKEIQETQLEIFDFLKQKEMAKQIGNLNILSDIHTNYKFNWDNETYKKNKHIQVQEIKRDAEHSIILYRELIRKLAGKGKFLSNNADHKKLVNNLKANFAEYQSALYLYSFSTFLEVILLENFDSDYLAQIEKNLIDYSYNYRELYTNAVNVIEYKGKQTVESQLIEGFAGFNKIVGKTVAKLPVISKSKFDESLIESSEKMLKFKNKMADKTLENFIENQSAGVQPFIQSVNRLKAIYSGDLELIIDNDAIYIAN